ncbi:MAG: sugar ABC transporter ATP-binding protein [Myxococcales bacterium]|nr:sugar ABC transporter ATP-binding protein [Myxococcales bacterium]
MNPLLKVENLSVCYVNEDEIKTAVDQVSFEIRPGEIVGFVGESGCGKSSLMKAIMRILPAPGFIAGGHVYFNGEDILAYSAAQMSALRWREASMVFQSAMNSLNPVMRISDQFHDTMIAHGETNGLERKQKIERLLSMVGLQERWRHAYPHELSGGMRQRVGIALALDFEPQLVVMDEPTTALDVIVQSEILTQIKQLQRDLGFAICFVSHDLPVVSQLCDRVNVFYEGHLVEEATVEDLIRSPQHAHTQDLLRSSTMQPARGR